MLLLPRTFASGLFENSGLRTKKITQYLSWSIELYSIRVLRSLNDFADPEPHLPIRLS